MTKLSIGAMAATTGVKVPTIRYYESIGLLRPPPRTDGNRRSYDGDALRRLRFIRHARELGFDVPAIRELLQLADSPQDAPCDDADRIAATHLAAIESKIERLEVLRAEVQRMVDCPPGTIATCRVIEVLAEADHEHDGAETI